MSRICKITKRKFIFGNKISYSNKKNKRKFFLNLHNHKFFIKSKKKYIKLKLSKLALNLFDKGLYKKKILLNNYVKKKKKI